MDATFTRLRALRRWVCALQASFASCNRNCTVAVQLMSVTIKFKSSQPLVTVSLSVQLQSNVLAMDFFGAFVLRVEKSI